MNQKKVKEKRSFSIFGTVPQVFHSQLFGEIVYNSESA
jgi:hypothetical protein